MKIDKEKSKFFHTRARTPQWENKIDEEKSKFFHTRARTPTPVGVRARIIEKYL
jgi:hypothetical protein